MIELRHGNKKPVEDGTLEDGEVRNHMIDYVGCVQVGNKDLIKIILLISGVGVTVLWATLRCSGCI